jgi:hypothetical protein
MNLNDALILLVADKLELLETMECLGSSQVRACSHNPRKSGLRARKQSSVQNLAVFLLSKYKFKNIFN